MKSGEPRMRKYITTNNGHTFYINETLGERGTIIGSHGLTGNYKQLYYYQTAFSDSYQFISYDILGRGNSSAASLESSIETHADALVDLIQSLNIKNPILLGYSMGAYISALVASRLKDVKGLILLDGGGVADEDTRNLVLPSLDRLQKTFNSPEHYAREMMELYRGLKVNWNRHLEEVVHYEIKENSSGWSSKSNAELIRQDFESFYRFNSEKVFSNIQCPIFLVVSTGGLGNKGPLFKKEGYEQAQKTAPHIRTAVTPVNHYELVFNQQPEIIKEIEGFLLELDGSV